MSSEIQTYPFSQSRMLGQIMGQPQHPGICSALCYYWLNNFRRMPEEGAADRMSYLSRPSVFSAAMAHQSEYGRNRSMLGPEAAKVLSGASLGLAVDPDITGVFSTFQSLDEMLNILMRDIHPGQAAAWSLRFASGGGHVIAGFCNIRRKGPQTYEFQAHVFDPNIGEVVGPHRHGLAMLKQIAQHYMGYNNGIASIARVGVNELL